MLDIPDALPLILERSRRRTELQIPTMLAVLFALRSLWCGRDGYCPYRNSISVRKVKEKVPAESASLGGHVRDRCSCRENGNVSAFGEAGSRQAWCRQRLCAEDGVAIAESDSAGVGQRERLLAVVVPPMSPSDAQSH